jgi:hypothetical protein
MLLEEDGRTTVTATCPHDKGARRSIGGVCAPFFTRRVLTLRENPDANVRSYTVTRTRAQT